MLSELSDIVLYKLSAHFSPRFMQTLSREFYVDALSYPDSVIYIVDEHGKLWPCYLRRGYGSESKTWVITKGWARFSRFKGFKQGQKIMFGVTSPHSNMLHFIPVV